MLRRRVGWERVAILASNSNEGLLTEAENLALGELPGFITGKPATHLHCLSRLLILDRYFPPPYFRYSHRLLTAPFTPNLASFPHHQPPALTFPEPTPHKPHTCPLP